ncbi:1-aminocyclopropane-1-carboxylate deaminase/D-cysteine desulfhydrase [Abyssalbus ytuae]|uniref:1-aminocyclopropane-1-carboxylate deaminase/D-cysteine desulfhydrase n=1 Tax=Abyssalbus ytuae TaxID=2926907 RepID=UPI0034E2F6D9
MKLSILEEKSIQLFIKRDDLIHPHISGNKYRKLKYNLIEASNKGFTTLLTFGGAYSNHIAAVAAAGKEKGFKTIGIIRGEELWNRIKENPTLKFAKECGMEFKFISRGEYRKKTDKDFIERLYCEFGNFYLVPEGGTNALAVKGCEEILTENDFSFDVVGVAVGTGGTISGIINCSQLSQQVLGFPALKGDFLNNEIVKFASKRNWKLVCDYHFGGYAKINEELITFINDFKIKTHIPLDPVYTGKMLFGLMDMIKNDEFEKGTKILAIHTGGLQGIKGMNLRNRKKGLSELL